MEFFGFVQYRLPGSSVIVHLQIVAPGHSGSRPSLRSLSKIIADLSSSGSKAVKSILSAFYFSHGVDSSRIPLECFKVTRLVGHFIPCLQGDTTAVYIYELSVCPNSSKPESVALEAL